MSLIKSISGIRGTIGGRAGEGLSALDVVKFTSAYATFIKNNLTFNSDKSNLDGRKCRIVVGRDARLSGKMVERLVVGTLMSMGCDVINIGKASTPTTELAVAGEKADGGIIITASHNPMQWNALKLLNAQGEFLNDSEGKEIISIAEKEDFNYSEVLCLGKEYKNDTWRQRHIDMVKALEEVDTDAISKADFKVAVDAVNSVGGEIVPDLLRALGVRNVIELNCEANGKFAHTPEPIPENLTQISDLMSNSKADIGFVVDPDVDRLAIVCEDGTMFGEEYTLVAVADYLLSGINGKLSVKPTTVSNLSSSRALRDITKKFGGEYHASAVGEVNVVAMMKETNAVIGGEGNGGVIYPKLHYGRDALVGIALFLTLLAKEKMTVSELRKKYPEYFIAKNKINLSPDLDIDAVLHQVKVKYSGEKVTDIDGVKIDFPEGWVHIRKSNTEPIVRIYSEAHSLQEAERLASDIISCINDFAK